MTPRAFFLLVDRMKAARKHSLYCAALTTCAIYNVNRSEKGEFLTPEKLMGDEAAPASTSKQSPADMLSMVRNFINPAFGGSDKADG